MFITAKHTSEQWGLKGQCVQKVRFEMADLKLPRACNDDHLIALALKQCLSERS